MIQVRELTKQYGRKTAVGRMLNKLGLRDRVQAVVYAYEHGLVRPQSRP